MGIIGLEVSFDTTIPLTPSGTFRGHRRQGRGGAGGATSRPAVLSDSLVRGGLSGTASRLSPLGAALTDSPMGGVLYFGERRKFIPFCCVSSEFRRRRTSDQQVCQAEVGSWGTAAAQAPGHKAPSTCPQPRGSSHVTLNSAYNFRSESKTQLCSGTLNNFMLRVVFLITSSSILCNIECALKVHRPFLTSMIKTGRTSVFFILVFGGHFRMV